ncbi:MAG: hypothetical protein KA953_09470 [Lachnospiraceae bacterium]|nr:hypothetical protein [Lachnospiraceae bacterium]
MNISGLRPYEALDHFKVDKEVIAKAQADHISQMAVSTGVEEKKAAFVSMRSESSKDSSNRLTASDLAKNFKATTAFSWKGSESDLSKLDQENVPKPADKDSVLRQYQFYVGPKDSVEEELKITQNAKQLENFDFV